VEADGFHPPLKHVLMSDGNLSEKENSANLEIHIALNCLKHGAYEKHIAGLVSIISWLINMD
jgi:hypothetical protein